MFAIETPGKPLPGRFELTASIQPGLMHAIAGAVNMAAPNALETDDDVTESFRTQSIELVGKADGRSRTQLRDLTELPCVRRPLVGRKQPRFMAKIDNSL